MLSVVVPKSLLRVEIHLGTVLGYASILHQTIRLVRKTLGEWGTKFKKFYNVGHQGVVKDPVSRTPALIFEHVNNTDFKHLYQVLDPIVCKGLGPYSQHFIFFVTYELDQ
jgi:hypothetical protein